MALQFGKVTGRFVAVVADSPEDSDSDPDIVPLQGVVTFTLKAPALLVPDAEPFPMTALPAPVSATLDSEGYLTLNGTRSVTLLASNGQHNPTSTTYEVKFALKHGTISVPYSTFNISVPAGETVNLTTIAPVPSSSGSPIVQGVGIKEVTADDGAFVFKMTNGTENRVGIPAIEPPVTTTARCVQSVVLDGSSLVFSFTDETSERVDLSSLSGGGVVVPPDTDDTPLPKTPARRAVVLGTSHSDKTWTQSGDVWWWQVAADRAGLSILDSYAVGGMDTEGALTGWSGATPQIESAERSTADLALVEFGGNDVKLGVTPEQFRERLTKIVVRLKATGKRVVIVFPPPLFASLQAGFGNEYGALRQVAREVAAANTSYYTDAWEALTLNGPANPAYDSGDNMHLNGAGQLAWGTAVAADIQAFAGVEDPYDGTRDRYWFDPATHTGDESLIQMLKNPDDTLFRGNDGAILSAGAEDLSIFNDISSEVGSRWELSFAYRIESPSDQDGATSVQVEWPGPTMRDLPGKARLVGQEGVRRVEMVVPEEATGTCVTALRIPGGATGLKIRVGQLGVRRLNIPNNTGR